MYRVPRVPQWQMYRYSSMHPTWLARASAWWVSPTVCTYLEACWKAPYNVSKGF